MLIKTFPIRGFIHLIQSHNIYFILQVWQGLSISIYNITIHEKFSPGTPGWPFFIPLQAATATPQSPSLSLSNIPRHDLSFFITEGVIPSSFS